MIRRSVVAPLRRGRFAVEVMSMASPWQALLVLHHVSGPATTDGWVTFGTPTAAAAAAPAVMAYLTRSVATSTREEASETRRLAQQAQDDRELAWRPVLGARWDVVEKPSEISGGIR